MLVLASVVPLLAFTLALQYLDYRMARSDTGERAAEFARGLSVVVEHELGDRIIILEVLALSPALRSGDVSGFRQEAEAVLARQLPGSDILLLTADGQQVMNTLPPVGTPLPKRRTLDSLNAMFASGVPVVSDVFTGALRNRPIVAIDVPVKGDDGRILYDLSINPSVEAFGAIIRQQRPPEGWVVSIFDGHGVNIAHTPNGDRFIGEEAAPELLDPLLREREAVIETTSLEGVPLLTAIRRVGPFPWSVAVGVPLADLTAPAFATAMRTLAVGGILLLVSLALALAVGRQITRPIAALRRYASASGSGPLTPAPTGLDEADDVAQALASAEAERRQNAAALERNAHFLEWAQEVAQLGSWITDRTQGGRIEWSRQVYRIFGIEEGRFDGRFETFLSLVHPDDRAAVAEASRRFNEAGELYRIDHRILRPDGTVRWVHERASMVRDAGGKPAQLLGIVQDITEKRLVEQQLAQSQKMEAIGNLTGGLAHDFNNLLGIIIGNLDLARPAVAGLDDTDALVGDALDAAFRGAELTRHLLAFARRQPLEPVPVDLNALAAGMGKLLSRTLGENIAIVFDLAPDLWSVVVDPAQLEAGLVNLATNARDAMPQGGRLRIVTANRSLDEDYALVHGYVPPGDYAMVEVSDTGKGMTRDVLSHIFEPFFTTKDRDKGSGLGLSMVYGFMKQSGGHINVYSEPGLGTTFRLYLPRDLAGAPVVARPAAPAETQGGSETVLAVEDNAALRRVVVRQLSDLGYRVLEAENAAAALRILEETPVHLLLTDVILPDGVDGFALAHKVLARWPRLKVVLTSGFPDVKLNGEFGPVPKVRLLSKPYRKQDLAQTLREVLDGKKG